MRGIWRRLHEEERGIALITAMMMTMIVLTLSVVMVNLAIHNSTSSAQDRARVQAVHAAEAGIDVVYSQMRQYGYASLPCSQDNDLATTPVEHYHVVVQYYSVYPPTGNAMVCPLTQNPAGAVITSTGSAPGANVSVPASRIMQSEVRMSLITGTASFLGTVYGQTGVTMNNTITLNGNVGNDASVYTGGTWTCSNSGSVAGSVYATAVSQSGPACTVNQDVWANGSISAASLMVGHDMTSSTSSISLSGSSHVTHNATSGTTCTGCSTRVSGTVTTNHTSPPPPIPTFPTINYNAADWTNAGYTINTYNNCTTAGNFIQDVGSATKYVVRITPACTLKYNNRVTINVRNDLAIITDGDVNFSNRVDFASADGAAHTVFVIVPKNSTNCGPGSLNFNNTVGTSIIQVFMYTPCSVAWTNSTGLNGQIFGGSVNVTNTFTLNYKPITVPGFTSSIGYNVDIAYIREVNS